MGEPDKVPDLLALTLSEAQTRLGENGWRVGRVTETKPPWGGSPQGEPRVLRQEVGPDMTVDLLVAAPGFRRGGSREK